MSVPTINPLPNPPARAEAPVDFTSKMDAFVAALPNFAAEANALAEYVGDKAPSGLLSWAYTQAFRVVLAVRDENSAIISADIIWPDGVTGTFTTDVASTAFPGAIDAWHANYGESIVKQPQIVRDLNGAVVSQPAIEITP